MLLVMERDHGTKFYCFSVISKQGALFSVFEQEREAIFRLHYEKDRRPCSGDEKDHRPASPNTWSFLSSKNGKRKLIEFISTVTRLLNSSFDSLLTYSTYHGEGAMLENRFNREVMMMSRVKHENLVKHKVVMPKAVVELEEIDDGKLTILFGTQSSNAEGFAKDEYVGNDEE